MLLFTRVANMSGSTLHAHQNISLVIAVLCMAHFILHDFRMLANHLSNLAEQVISAVASAQQDLPTAQVQEAHPALCLLCCSWRLKLAGDHTLR